MSNESTNLSTAQVIGLCISLAVPASLGSAYAVSASDAVQDEKISQIERHVEQIDATLTETRDVVIVMQPQVEKIEKDVAKIDETLSEILRVVRAQ